jgi:LysR family cys regulon transcriptional activator
MPCYQWNRCVVVKKDHPLAQCKRLTLAMLATYPLITYVYGFTGRYKVDEAFASAQLQSNIILTAVDADVIKTYVRLGLGVGIIARMAFEQDQDNDLVALDASELFGTSVTHIALLKDRFLREYIYRFIALFAPHLNEKVVKQAMLCADIKERKIMFRDFVIPAY